MKRYYSAELVGLMTTEEYIQHQKQLIQHQHQITLRIFEKRIDEKEYENNCLKVENESLNKKVKELNDKIEMLRIESKDKFEKMFGVPQRALSEKYEKLREDKILLLDKIKELESDLNDCIGIAEKVRNGREKIFKHKGLYNRWFKNHAIKTGESS